MEHWQKKLNCPKPIFVVYLLLLMEEHQEENKTNQLTIESWLSKKAK
jgi:hypothetical protein